MIFKKICIGVILSVLSFQTILAQGSYNQLVFEGNRSFKSKNYEDSSLQFKKATDLNSKDFTAQYNLGNSYFKSNKLDDARSAYKKAEKLAKSKFDKAAALYNIGNIYMKSNEADKAAEFYKQSLKNDPYNEQIRKNYEIAKLKKKEQENKENQKQNSGKGGGSDQNKDQNKEPGKDPKNQQGNGKNSNSSDDGDGSDKSKQPKKDNGNLPKELEEAMLNRATNKERETAQKILNKNSFSLPQSNDKDW